MVVGDGSILTANENENTDLFWAVRGGGCNFGVCVQFVLQLHEQRKTVYSGLLIYPPPLLDQLFKVTQEWWNNSPSEKSALFMVFAKGPPPERLASINFAPITPGINFDSSPQPCVIILPFYNGTEEEGRKAFKAFLDLRTRALLFAGTLIFIVNQNLSITRRRCHSSLSTVCRYADA